MADPPLKKRLASGRACTNCRKRKNRCDGTRPKCSPCQLRGSLCLYPSMVDELSLDELRSLVDIKSRANVEVLSEGPEQVQQRPYFDDDDDAVADVTIQNKVVTAQTPLGTTPSESQDPEPFFGESSTFAFVSKVQTTNAPRQALTPANKRRRLSSSRSSQTHSLDPGLTPRDCEDTYGLPSRDLADSLVDLYFNHVHRLYPFVHEPSFRTQYERMWINDAEHSDTKATWLAVLNLIFAHGCEFHDPIEGRSASYSATRFLARARNIVFAHIFKEGNLELVQALLLMCHYLQGTLELTECWSLSGLMIRTSISIGLHQNPSPAMSAVEREVSKRVWWGCFVIDRTLSMKFGRPPSIPTGNASDVEFPLPVDDQYIMNDSIVPRQPANRPSLTSFFVQTIKLAHIIDSVLLKLYSSSTKPWTSTNPSPNKQDHFTEIFGHSVLLDGELVSWWNANPPHLKEEPNYPDGPDFQRQRNVMFIRFLNVRLLLHRQSFLIFSRQEIEDSFHRDVAIASCNRCILAARETIRVIYAQYRRGLLNSLWYNLHYVFTAIGVLLTLQTMERWKLNALGQTGTDETLELGMEFLKAASGTSTLAARYLILLERIQTQTSGRETPLPGQLSGQGHLTQHQPDGSDPALLSADRTPWQRPQDEPQLTLSSDLIDFDDLLFGTGLPRDLLSADWSGFEPL
ncbi:Fungal specific transcription factor domain-containing protein [Cladophialophora immunda]|nr:Fungal specific transcription factor domain-containing protein [Cladophialophora immunda]